MNFTMSDKQVHWRDRVVAFMAEHIAPAVPVYRQQTAPGAVPGWSSAAPKCRAQGLRHSTAHTQTSRLTDGQTRFAQPQHRAHRVQHVPAA